MVHEAWSLWLKNLPSKIEAFTTPISPLGWVEWTWATLKLANGLAQQLVGRLGQHAEEKGSDQSHNNNPYTTQQQLKQPLLALLAEIALELTGREASFQQQPALVVSAV